MSIGMIIQQKKWANAKTSDGSMWVWIPRYAYSITSGYHSSSAGNIEVEFMKGLTNETSTGRTTFKIQVAKETGIYIQRLTMDRQ